MSFLVRYHVVILTPVSSACLSCVRWGSAGGDRLAGGGGMVLCVLDVLTSGAPDMLGLGARVCPNQSIYSRDQHRSVSSCGRVCAYRPPTGGKPM